MDWFLCLIGLHRWVRNKFRFANLSSDYCLRKGCTAIREWNKDVRKKPLFRR